MRLLISRLAKSLDVSNNREVSFVTNPQIWTMIGVFCTVMLGSLGLFARMIRSDINALNQKIDTKIDALSSVMDAKFTDVDHRFESLETDMNLIKGHLIGKIPA